jgi:predicted permease
METELSREVAHHLHELTKEYERRGHSHEEAARMAKREFGGSEQVKERCRDERRFAWMTGLGQDAIFALRQMRRSPGFVFTAVLTLSLGIAANVIVFGVLQTLILQSVNLPHGERVMTLQLNPSVYPFIGYPAVRDVRDGNTVFTAVAVTNPLNFGMEANGVTRPAWAYAVSGQYFEVMGIRPHLGRLLERADDERPGASQAVVLSWPGWKSYFGGDPDIVGKTVRLNKHAYTVVGVTPEGFYGTEKFLTPSLFVPLTSAAAMPTDGSLEQRRAKIVFSVVRLKEGVTLPQAQAELNAIAARIRQQYPTDEEGLNFKLTRTGLIGDTIGGPASAFLAGLMGLAGIVLLAACVNLGSLFAARTADRAREVSIRLAIGSSRWRVLRQLLVEALAISILGGVFACGLSWMVLTALANWRPPSDYPIELNVMPQPSLILVALVVSMLAGVLFGMMPLRQIFKADPIEAIKSGALQSFAGRRWAVRDVLLAAQIALCCVTVTAAFVSLKGMGKALTMDLGFQPRNAVVTKFDPRQAGYSNEAAAQLQRELLDRISQLPQVQAAGYANTVPMWGDNSSTDIYTAQTADFRPSNKAFAAAFFQVSPGYFAAAGTAVLAGRDVSFADTPNNPTVALVNREFARRLFHTEDVVGRYFKIRTGKTVQIIGIVQDGKYLAVSENQKPAMFYPITQRPSAITALVVRPARDIGNLPATIQKVIRDLDPAIPIRNSSVWSSQLAVSFLPTQVATVALGLFGAFGLLLSIAGTFGLASYTVSQRLRELSLRVALGAQAKQILAAALGRMLILMAGGSLTGIVLGVAASRLLSAIVYEASAQDPLVLVSVAFTMALTGLLSVAGPVRRALQIDPAKVLRDQ